TTGRFVRSNRLLREAVRGSPLPAGVAEGYSIKRPSTAGLGRLMQAALRCPILSLRDGSRKAARVARRTATRPTASNSRTGRRCKVRILSLAGCWKIEINRRFRFQALHSSTPCVKTVFLPTTSPPKGETSEKTLWGRQERGSRR